MGPATRSSTGACWHRAASTPCSRANPSKSASVPDTKDCTCRRIRSWANSRRDAIAGLAAGRNQFPETDVYARKRTYMGARDRDRRDFQMLKSLTPAMVLVIGFVPEAAYPGPSGEAKFAGQWRQQHRQGCCAGQMSRFRTAIEITLGCPGRAPSPAPASSLYTLRRCREGGGGWRRLKPDKECAECRCRPRSPSARRGSATGHNKPSMLRQVGRMVWVSPRHAALAPGTLLVYPVLAAVWQRLPRRGDQADDDPSAIAWNAASVPELAVATGERAGMSNSSRPTSPTRTRAPGLRCRQRDPA